MIPAFVSEGFLPPGIHSADINEFKTRFGYSIWRDQLFNSLVKLINDLKIIDCKALYVDGSYTTNKRLPGDIDVCWEDVGLDYDAVKRKMPILFDLDFPRLNQQSVYKADIFPAHLVEASSG